jgi:prevent-host-death family protein
MNIVAIRSRLADALNRVAYQGERIVLERRGKGVAALVSMDDLAALERMEDEIDAREANKALAEMKRKGLKPIPWEHVKAELGLRGRGGKRRPDNGTGGLTRRMGA